MVHRRVGAGEQGDVGSADVAEDVGHRAGADRLNECRDRRGVAKTRAMIDIVGAQRGPHQFLEKIGFLVRALGRAEAGERAGAVRFLHLPQPAGAQVECLIP